MRIKKMVIALLAAAMITVLTGCSVIESIFIRNPSDMGNGDYSVITASSPSALEDGCFYVEKGEKEYHKTYIGKKNYSDYYLTESVDPNRVIWFGKDYDRIPTMQKGEKIVFRSSQEFRPYFIIERFEDFGFTVGVCGLKETDTGRYILSASNYNYISVNPDSSAKALLDLGEHDITLEQIGGIKLRSGNISRAGTIIGLEEGKSYETDVYIGTDLHTYSLVADVRAMVSMELYRISDYQYERNHAVSFEFPEGLPSGYYCINGAGVVRYINSERPYSPTMDMNIPSGLVTDDSGNILYTEKEEPDAETQKDIIKSSSFRMDTDERVKIVLTYTTSSVDVAPPKAKVYGEYGVYTLNPDNDSENTLSGEYELPAGDYKIEVSELYGRDYKYKVIRLKEE